MLLKDKLKYLLFRKISEIKSQKTNRKILVIESDDWGSIRMANIEAYKALLKKGYPVDKNPYEKFDSLASVDDIQALYEVLCSVKDKHGKYAVLTPNVIMSNPDFDKIEKSNFSEYHYEHFTETLKSYGKTHEDSFDLWKEGLENNIFIPQYHGREHLNVEKYMNSLSSNNDDIKTFFKYRCIGALAKNTQKPVNYYVETNRYVSEVEKKRVINNYLDGYMMFENTFGYKSKTVIAPNYIWSPEWDSQTKEKGIIAYQGLNVFSEPILNNATNDNFKKYRVYNGRKNEQDQIYLVRNVFFEPSVNLLNNDRNVESCIRQINKAFKSNIPAIVSSHRLNYIGFIDENNRNKNLRMLRIILKEVKKKWPDVEFMSSDALALEIRTS